MKISGYNKESRCGKEFMDQLKRQWDQNWDPDKTRVSRETLKDNAIKLKKKVSLNEESDCKRKWRTEKGTIKHHVKQLQILVIQIGQMK